MAYLDSRVSDPKRYPIQQNMSFLLAALGFMAGGRGFELSCTALYADDMVGLGILRADLETKVIRSYKYNKLWIKSKVLPTLLIW